LARSRCWALLLLRRGSTLAMHLLAKVNCGAGGANSHDGMRQKGAL
jgi:hypothetical protein